MAPTRSRVDVRTATPEPLARFGARGERRGTFLFGVLWLLLATLPFESRTRVLVLQSAQLSNLDLLAVLAAIGAAVQPLIRAREGRPSQSVWRLPRADWPLALFCLWLAWNAVSALSAPSHREHALGFTARLALGAGVYRLVATTPTWTRLTALLWAILLGAGLSAAVGAIEALGWLPLFPALAPLLSGPYTLYGVHRLSATLPYPTITSMFFELAVPLAVALAARPTRWTAAGAARGGLAAAVALGGAGIVALTLTRGGLVALLAGLGLMAALAVLRRHYRPSLVPALAAAAGLVVTMGWQIAQSPELRARLVTETNEGWYGASYSVPDSLQLDAASTTRVELAIRNTGLLPWRSQGAGAVVLTYRWRRGDDPGSAAPPAELPLPADVEPGQAVRLTGTLQAPESPGTYALTWSLLQQGVTYFRDAGAADAVTEVTVRPRAGAVDAGSAPAPDTRARAGAAPLGAESPAVARAGPPDGPAVRSRRELWAIALRLAAERPSTGVGPDNFRYVWGQAIGQDTTGAWYHGLYHAHNLYLELLADTGVPGLAVFLVLIAVVGQRWWRLVSGPPPPAAGYAALGAGAALLAFLVHGGVDSFFEFLPITLLFSACLGLVDASYRLTHLPPPANGPPGPN